jgi:hypothetical protein
MLPIQEKECIRKKKWQKNKKQIFLLNLIYTMKSRQIDFKVYESLIKKLEEILNYLPALFTLT